MAHTFRRKRERHEYYWVLHDWASRFSRGHWVQLDPRSKAGRKALARFHSDKIVTSQTTRMSVILWNWVSMGVILGVSE